MIIDEQPMLELLAESAPIEGHALYGLLKQMAADVSQPVTPRTVSVSALDGPTVTQDTTEPKQLGLLDAIEPVPSHISKVPAHIATTERRATYAGLG
jgi:hypothetical protein